MNGKDVYRILKKIGADHVHHANSVMTSCTFLEQGGLLSRGYVEDRKLKQTEQSSDKIDKEFGIWHTVFVDHVDIHARGGRRKGPNQYGPVLFVIDIDVLLSLPSGSDVLVAKKNPIYWKKEEPDADKWFESLAELEQSIHFGDFDKMLMIKTPSGKLDFPKHRAEIRLDDPGKALSSGENAYDHAVKRLMQSAACGKVEVNIGKRECQPGCICLKKYAAMSVKQLEFWFG